MMINEHNYELYFIDYLDGNINPDQESELLAFLALHPDKKDELEALKQMHVTAGSEIFENKNSLKKSINDIPEINESNFDEFCIARLEGDLSITSLKKYQEFISQDREKQKVEDLYKRTFLKPETHVTFPAKSKLKKFDKKAFYRRLMYYSTSVAAAVLLAVVLFKLDRIPEEDSLQINPIVEKSTAPEKQNTPLASEQKPQLAGNSENKDQKQKAGNTLNPGLKKTFDQLDPASTEKESTAETNPDLNLELLAAITPSFEKVSYTYNIKTGQHTRQVLNHREKASDYQTLPQLALSKLNEKIKIIPADSLVEKAIPDLAEAGLQKLYAVLEKEVQIEKTIGDDGRTRSFSVNTRYFGFYTTRTKK